MKAINEQDWGDVVLCVRVNAWDTKWTYRDVVHVVENASERLDELMLPKVQCAADVEALDLLLTQIEDDDRPRRPGRRSSPRSRRRGGSSTSRRSAPRPTASRRSCSARPTSPASTEMPVLTGGVQIPEYPGDHFHYVFAKILMAGRANGLQVIDGPYLKIRDLDGLRDYASARRILGYDGKWALHPDQVTVINEVYTPTQEQFDRACDILEAYGRPRPPPTATARAR